MRSKSGKRSIFRRLFVPMLFIMSLQALSFYFAAVYGGIDESLRQNTADILSERLSSRANELEAHFNSNWTELTACIDELGRQYSAYETLYGGKPLAGDTQRQIDFLLESADILVDTLRYNETNGVYLIINDSSERQSTLPKTGAQLYGLCIRDMDQDSNYSGTEDLLLERAPSGIIDKLDCSLDSGWEAKYSFDGESDGDFYFAPLFAAWDGLSKSGVDLAYFSPSYSLSGSTAKMVSYSVPLLSQDGYPYAVLGVELSVKYLSSLLPNAELGERDRSCYVLAMQSGNNDEYVPIIGSGAMFSRCFGAQSAIERGEDASTGGFAVTGRDETAIYAEAKELKTYNNNSPFESNRLMLLAMVEHDSLFAYIGRIKALLMVMTLISLLLGAVGLVIVSKRFAMPITALAKRVRGMEEYRADAGLGRLGISEIDQLVDAIEQLNVNVNRNSARTEFFSRMSHDMRTPMNAILSFSSPEMLEGRDESEKDDYLQKIHASGVYLLGLINEVLDMTKIENNKTELHLSAVRAERLFEAVIPIIGKLAQTKGICFTADVEADAELTVLADTQHLGQAVMNLLSNAVKFTTTGGEVRFFAQISGEGSTRLCHITVSDTGIGMSEGFMKNLYTPFEQENSGREGTGLGLAIAKKLVELMDGTIECKSELGVGTCFTLELPLTVSESAPRSAQRGLPPSERKMFRGKRALVMEDNPINATIIARLLERVGLEVDIAENGMLGVELFKSSEIGFYSVIFMDIRMPVMDGLEASRTVRALNREDAKTIPIFAMTADAFAEDAEISRAAGMNAHLTKPIEPQKMYDTILRYIR